MKNKMFLFGLLAMVLLFAFSAIGCDNGTTDNGVDEQKVGTIIVKNNSTVNLNMIEIKNGVTNTVVNRNIDPVVPGDSKSYQVGNGLFYVKVWSGGFWSGDTLYNFSEDNKEVTIDNNNTVSVYIN